MTAQEQRALAWRIADDSEVFDFEKALELVERMPHEAERLIQRREEFTRQLEKLESAFRRLHRAAQAMQ